MNIRSCLATLVIVLVSLSPLRAGIPTQQAEAFPWQHYWQEAVAAYQKKDFAAFLENSKRAAALAPAVIHCCCLTWPAHTVSPAKVLKR